MSKNEDNLSQAKASIEETNLELQRSTNPTDADDGQIADSEHTLPETNTTAVSSLSLRQRVWNLAWPVISENFMETLLGVIDTILVASLGAAAIAGVGSALQVLFFVIAALSALAVGSAVLVAQAVGGKKLDQASTLGRQSIIWSILFSIPLALVGVIFSQPIIALFGLEPEVAQIGVDYLQVTMGTAVVMTTLIIGGGVLRGAGDSRTPMLVRLIANIVNVFLTYGLIFGTFGMPALGAVGSAWGSFLARSLALFLLLIVLWRGRMGVRIGGGGSWIPDIPVARRVLKIGVPAAMEQVLISAAFFAFTVVVAELGTVTLAAQRIAMIAMSLSFLPGIGFGIAATTLVGQSIGAKNYGEAAEAGKISTTWASMWMTGMGATLFIFAPQVMWVFTAEAEVIITGAIGLRMVSIVQPFWAILMVQSGAIRGTGETRLPMRVNATGVWLAVIIGFLLLRFVGDSYFLVWVGFLIVSPLMALILWMLFRRAIAKLAV